jgi:WD40 repeat protein
MADTQGVVRFIDLSTWRLAGAAVKLGATIAPQTMSFSPDGRTVVVVTEGPASTQLDAIDVPSRRIRRIRAWRGLVPPPPTVSAAVAYTPDGSGIAVSLVTESPTDISPSAERLLMLDASTGRTRWQRRYPMRPGQLQPYLAFTSTGLLLTSAQQGDTFLWNARTGRTVRRFPLGGEPVVSPHGDRVALGRNSPSLPTPSTRVAVLDLRTGKYHTLAADLPGQWIRSMAFAPDGARIVAGTTEGIQVWDVATGEISETYMGQPGRRAQVTVDPRNGSVISGDQDGSISVFDLSGAQRLGRFFSWNAPDQSCPGDPCAVVNRQGLMATDQGDGTIALVDLHTLRPTRTLPAREGAFANALAFAPGGRTLIAGGSNGHVVFWDVGSGRVERTLEFTDPVYWSAASPDGNLLAVQTQADNSSDSRVDVVRIATGEVLQSHLVRHGYAGIEFSRDGREIVAVGCCASGSTVVAWDTRTGVQLFSRSGGQNTTLDIAPDAHLLAVGTGDGKVLLLNALTGRRQGAPLQVASGHVGDVKFSPDGTTLALGSNDGAASLWDVRSRTRLGDPFPRLPGAVPSVVVEPNGRLLLTYLSNAYEWPTNLGTWERFACQVAGRDLTPQEWHNLLPGRAYNHVCPV